jgi:hypothetical protein
MDDDRSYALWHGADLAVSFESAEQALHYMGDHADELLGQDCCLMVFDGDGMAQVALVDARKDRA